jgi:hypothetical protein
MSDNIPEKKWYNVNLTEKIKKKSEEVRDFKLGLNDNIERFEKFTDEYSRKDINLNFIDRWTRKLYTNPQHLVKLEFVQYIIFIVLIYYYNPLNVKTKYPVFTDLLILSVAFIYVMLFFFIKMKVDENEDIDLIDPTESNILIKIISLIIFFVLFMLAIKGLIWLLINTPLLDAVRNMLGLFVFLGMLAIAYLFFRKIINKARNASGRKFTTLVIKFIMYIPCLMVDLAEYIKYEFNLTTKPVWLLLGMEGCLIALYYLVPYLFDKITTSDGIKLLNQPIYLSDENTLGNFAKLHSKRNADADLKTTNLDELYSSKINETANVDIDSNDNRPVPKYKDPNVPKNKYLAWIYNKVKNPVWIKVEKVVHPQYTDTKLRRFRYSYALSGWFYINPQPPNTRTAYTTYTNILKYGNKVNLEYNGQLNSLRVMAAIATKGKDIVGQPNDSVELYQTNNVLYQKWNNIVINYDEGYLDLFMNGELVASRSGVAPYMSFDSIVAGADTGILGGICNVTYYETPLSQSTIKLTYKALEGKKYPYVWRLKDDVSLNLKPRKNQKFIDDIKQVFGA